MFTFEEMESFGQKLGSCYAYLGRLLSEEYEHVIQIDSDSIVTGPLNELLEGDYDIAAPLNNSPADPVLTVEGIPQHLYVNAGLISVKNATIWQEWHNMVSVANRYKYIEQDTLNILLHTSGYKVRRMELDTNCYYGTASRGIWKLFRMEEKRLLYNNYLVKIIHWANGEAPKLTYKTDGFDPQVVEYLDYLVSD